MANILIAMSPICLDYGVNRGRDDDARASCGARWEGSSVRRGNGGAVNVVLGSVLAVFGSALIAVVVSQVVYRLLPARIQLEFRGHGAPIAVTVGALFALTAWLAIAIAQTELADASKSVRSEAGAVVDLYWYAETVPDPAKTKIKAALRAYTTDVRAREWQEMADRDLMSVQADGYLAQIRTQLAALAPAANGPTARYGQALTELDVLTGARRDRANAMTEGIPRDLWFGLAVSGLLLLAVVLVFGGPGAVTRGVLACVAGGGIAFVIVLAQQLDHPFQGVITVSGQPFAQAAEVFDTIDAISKN
jgi:hypothetical protein